jgi:nicotinate phosphoribosyltransferase
MVRAGERVWDEPLATSRERHQRSRDELPMDARHLTPGEPAVTTVFLEVRT